MGGDQITRGEPSGRGLCSYRRPQGVPCPLTVWEDSRKAEAQERALP